MFGFNKVTLLAALSLFLFSAITLHHGVEEKDTQILQPSYKSTRPSIIQKISKHQNPSRRLGIVSIGRSALSSILKFLFESPLSGKNVKTLSCFVAFGLAEVDFAKTEK